jgi:large conductance mechanosensitive channel
MKKFFGDFKAFITKGNIVDMAVGVVIGTAFGAIVTSLVNDIIMPLVSLATGGLDISDWKWVIRPEEVVDGVTRAECALHWGNFLQCILNFLIIAFCIFTVLRIFMAAKTKMERAQAGYKTLNKKEYKELKKQLKAQGKTNAEIKAAVARKEEELTAAAKAEEERKAAEAKAAAPATSEQLLAEIRDLLKARTEEK